MQMVYRVALFALIANVFHGLYRYYRKVESHLNAPRTRKLSRTEQYWGTTDFQRKTGHKWVEGVKWPEGCAGFTLPFPGGITAIFDTQGKYINTHMVLTPGGMFTWN